MNDLEKFFTEVSERVDAELERLVPREDIAPERLYKAIRWSLFGDGKRFRPALVFAAGRSFSAADKALVSTAAAVEMVHTYSLIHDDLPAMDNDDLRRGRATAHKKFNEATAILAGDALQAMAFEAIARDTALSKGLRLELVSELAIAAGRMVAGQQLDLEAEGKQIDRVAVDKIHAGKTAALISFSVRAGGLIAEANGEEMDALTRFGERLGLLFQITDDILDATASSDDLGKTPGKDACRKKATYVELFGIEKAKNVAAAIADEASAELRRFPPAQTMFVDICRYVAQRAA